LRGAINIEVKPGGKNGKPAKDGRDPLQKPLPFKARKVRF